MRISDWSSDVCSSDLATAADNTIVCTAPSKTFNLAGLHTSNVIIPNPAIRERFQTALAACAMPGMKPFGIVATEAAYREGEPWLEAVMQYVAGNARRLRSEERRAGKACVSTCGTRGCAAHYKKNMYTTKNNTHIKNR